AKTTGELRSLGEELNLLKPPLSAMRVVLALTDHASFCIAPAIHDRDALAPDALSAHHVSNLRLRRSRRECALEVLTPEHAFTAARQQSHVVRRILIPAELIVGATVLLQTSDDELLRASGEISSPRALTSRGAFS